MGQQRMRRSGIVAVAAAGIALGTAFGPPLAGAAAEKVQDVLVLNNEDSEAIATRAVGTTPVAVTGTTPVEVTGTPTVQVGGTPTVKVASSNAEPVVVQQVAPASTPVAEPLQWSFGGSRNDVANYEVPAGKRLTIEHVSGDDFDRPVGFEDVVVRATTSGRAVTHRLLAEKQGAQTDVFSQSVKIVADPGTTVVFGLTLDAPVGSDTSTLFMHGAFAGTLTDVAP